MSPVARRGRARALGAFVPKLTEKAFEKFGFSTVLLVSEWSHIVGADLARITMPERLRWPKAASKYQADDDMEAGRPGAVLVLRVEPACALDVEYSARQIIERVNAFFGYRAIDRIKLLQRPVIRSAPADGAAPISLAGFGSICARPTGAVPQAEAKCGAGPAPSGGGLPGQAAELAPIKDERLRAALERLQKSVSG